jgi:starch-binding outer membrane protein, SusD/RagB family
MKLQFKYKIHYLLWASILWIPYSCKKLVEIPPPINSITISQVFSTDAQAASAMAGIYFNMINSGSSPYGSTTTIYVGASADEFNFFDQGNNSIVQFQDNTLLSTNATVIGAFWTPSYSTIYGCNAVIEGLENTNNVDDSTKSELTGEAEFVRAFANFYLVNLFGDPALVTTTNYQKTDLSPNSSSAAVYAAIVADLKDAITKLHADYSAGKGQRVVPNKWAATALLARVYLYMNDWSDAEKLASSVINNTGLYQLSPLGGTGQVFSTNSTEAIWQLQQSNAPNSTFENATPEGYALIPGSATGEPFLYLTASLLNAFEKGDQRRSYWVDSTNYFGVTYYYPYKYKIGESQAVYNGPYSEYYMVLRLAEQYLIRSEAEAHLNDLANATNDLDLIRGRAGLPNTTAFGQTDLLAAIEHENQIEFFAEWGHRWLDLKRTGQAIAVLKPLKPKLNSNSLLYPIPFSEITTDPNLKQNPGY